MENSKNHKIVVTDTTDWTSLTKLELNEKLLWACTIRDEKTIERAIDSGADVNCRRSNSMTPLHIAAEHGDLEMMRLLYKAPLLKAESKTMHGLTPMHTAVLLGHTRVIRELVKIGASTRTTDSLDRCPLHYAALHKNIDCAKTLVKLGSPIHVYDAFNESPLDISVLKTKNLPMIELLISSKSRRTPFAPRDAQCLLLEAILSSQDAYDIEIIDMIINYAGNVINLSDSIGWRTPLHIVGFTGYYELAEYLIDRGADLNAKNRANQTPMEVALNCKNFSIVRLIEDRSRSMENELPEVLENENGPS